jgi:hypothetical protein
MNFREATDDLFRRVDQERLAETLGVSIASIRQARLRPEAAAHRSPPTNWREAVIKLAEEQARFYKHLLERLRTETTH